MSQARTCVIDPNPSSELLRSCPTFGATSFGLRLREAAVRGYLGSAISGPPRRARKLGLSMPAKISSPATNLMAASAQLAHEEPSMAAFRRAIQSDTPRKFAYSRVVLVAPFCAAVATTAKGASIACATQRQLIGTIQHVGMRGTAWLGLVSSSPLDRGWAVSAVAAKEVRQPAKSVKATTALST